MAHSNTVVSNRRLFIGGSDARIIMGSDEAALLRLWQQKRGEIEPVDLSQNLIVQLGVATEAWSPLVQGSLLENDTVTSVADAHSKTPAQVLIRWHIQLGNIVIPKSVTPERIVSNFDVFDFELSEQDMASISSLGDGTRLGPDPRTFNFTG